MVNIPQKILLLNFFLAHVMHFSKIKEYATGAATNADLLSAIERVAVFVRGCWVVRR